MWTCSTVGNLTVSFPLQHRDCDPSSFNLPADMSKSYILAPNWDIVPNEYLCLGHIIRNPADPLNTLNTTTRVVNLQPPASPSRKGTFSATLAGHGAIGVAFWARLTDMLPIGAKASANFHEDGLNTFTIKTLETRFFMPSIKYLEDSIAASSEVQSALKRTRFLSSLYIVTGVKIANGAKFSQSTSKGSSGQLEAVADSGQGASVGVETSVAKDSSGTQSFENSSPFVFAFQLRKVLYKKRAILGTEPHNEGAMLGADDDNGEERKKRFMAGIEVEGLEGVDTGLDTFGPANTMLFQAEGDEDCLLWDSSKQDT